MLTEAQVRQTLATVKYPGFSRDILSFGLVKAIVIEGSRIGVLVEVTTSDPSIPEQLKTSITEAVRTLPGVQDIEVDIRTTAPLKAVTQDSMRQTIPGVRHVIAVASGKGGVGKSTVAANLAVALHTTGLRTGLLDCDLYGPSMGLMFGTTERPTVTEDERINPIQRHGLALMSMSFLIDDDAPVILRGPMVTRYTQQFLRQVNWGHLDVLVLDLPPGTGDIQLTIVQTVALTGAVIVTTPQEVALIDARKAVRMFEKVNVPVLGLIENMSFFACPSDGKIYHIFGEGGGRREAERLGVPLLAQIPIDLATREAGDQGCPITLSQPQHPAAEAFKKAAQQLRPRFVT